MKEDKKIVDNAKAGGNEKQSSRELGQNTEKAAE